MHRAAAGMVSGVALLAASMTEAKEYPVGKPQSQGGMEVDAVYLQPIEMDPPGMMRDAKDSDVHLEADIKASKDNKNGFAREIGYRFWATLSNYSRRAMPRP